MLVTERGIVIDSSFEQPSKVFGLIAVTEPGIVKLSSSLHFENV